MATTYTLINKANLGSSQANITFNSIPATYTDLKLVISVRSTEAGGSAQSTSLLMDINGSSANRNWRRIFVFNGTSNDSSTGTSTFIGTIPGQAVTANTFNNIEIYFPNYTSSNNKSFSIDAVTENNSSTNNNLTLLAGLWSVSDAISSLTITSAADNLAQYSSAYLYGISNS
jgi:hypothetical protein